MSYIKPVKANELLFLYILIASLQVFNSDIILPTRPKSPVNGLLSNYLLLLVTLQIEYINLKPFRKFKLYAPLS